ncbi:hypothetical protein [Methylacidimicrobium sp. B4]|uniref:hypothetical protein n=1 Tax=Methylacidimicrobium sp. B4 TaxID=2796139 RepID=UPI001A8CFDF3|nr:hypothetical protein [Methylacidimicrobium sp. B4]QSR85587.1 hypothetical protein MacB4_05040 [Methylacidimicrobium sp. B4]
MGRSELVLAACFIAGVVVGGTSLRAGDRPGPDGQAPEECQWEARQKIVQLLELPDDRLLAELEKWPRFQKMGLGQKGKFLERIARVRMEHHRAAEREAERLGLKLSDDQKAAFEREYWKRREEIAHQIWKETEGQRKELREKMEKELKAQFASKEG